MKLRAAVAIPLLVLVLDGSEFGGPAKVLSGNSLQIRGRIVRLGFHAPDLQRRCPNADGELYDCGVQAKTYLQELVGQRFLRCRFDPGKLFGKNSALPLLRGCVANGNDLARMMIRAGWAVPFPDSPYIEDALEAKSKNLGIWQGSNCDRADQSNFWCPKIPRRSRPSLPRPGWLVE